MNPIELVELLKTDALGRIELLRDADRFCVRRVAGGRVWGSGIVARILMRREARALRACADLRAVPHLLTDARWQGVASTNGMVPPPGRVLLRTYLPGVTLAAARSLPEDFFDLLDRLVRELHARGVCHNDLHKEQNILVDPEGRPAVVDFQLASVHRRASALFRSRVGDDLRHVDKHRRRYLRAGQSRADDNPVGGTVRRRSVYASLWRRVVKPVYNITTRTVLRTSDGESRRPREGPWPAWTPPVGVQRRTSK